MKAENIQQAVPHPRGTALPLRQSWNRSTMITMRPRKRVFFSGKILFDSSLSFLGIILSSPLWLLIALAIFLEDGQPIFYRQSRVGKLGKIFDVLKFRTMQNNAEEGMGPVQALKNDPRITRVGNWLRKTALDELPQLWNILMGEMSFVGPRPLRPGETLANELGENVRLEDVPGFRERVTVTPGLTGLAQIYAPRNIHHRQKFRYDLLYVKKRNFRIDLKLIALGFLRSLRGRWEA